MDPHEISPRASEETQAAFPDPPTEPAPRTLFGRYRVLRELGAGGMGRVVLAHDSKLGIDVAVKILPPEVARDPMAIEELRKEVLRGMSLTFPGIVRTYNFEQDDEGAGIVMEYVAGDTLGHLKSQQVNGCFDCEDIEDCLVELCAVLDYAHRDARIVHRDLKPGNLLVTCPTREYPKGRLKVADFGLAAILSDAALRHSREGKASGTPPYMSPQQARGERPTQLDDIYSLGATIYDLLTSTPPFYHGNITLQIDQMLAPTMAQRRLERGIVGQAPIPVAWEKTIASCLAKDPAQRPQSAGEVMVRLRSSESITVGRPQGEKPPASEQKSEPINPPPANPPVDTARANAKRPPWRWVGAALATSCVAVAAFTFLPFHLRSNPQPLPPAPPPAPAPVPAPGKSPLELIHAANATDPFRNGIGMKLVPVPISGGPTDSAQSKIAVLFATTETTVAQYETFIAATNRPWPKPDFPTAPDHPAVNVTWDDATAFCAWLTETEHAAKRLPEGANYRLPSDHEWSCAAGIGDKEKADDSPKQKRGAIAAVYPWGTAWPPPPNSGNYADAAARKAGVGTVYLETYDDGFAQTCPVETFPPNALGLYGLGGNASEWCDDWYDPSNKDTRTLRGGSWADGEELYLRSSFRGRAGPGERFAGYGFRCVLEAPDL